MKLNENFLRLKQSYLFSLVAEKVSAYEREHPNKRVLRLSIGDVTRPLAPAVIEEMHRAVDDLSRAETFRGYAPGGTTYGYDFLLSAVQSHYKKRGVELSFGEIFISDGAKSDLGNILDLFDRDNTVLIPDPVYPAYFDANVMAGRRIVFANASEENGFLPLPGETEDADLIYLCSPNNPTGAVYSREQLKAWVDYANARGAVILFDAAYEMFVSDGTLPRSVFEIEGARECAVEICSFSKTAGFTGVRCGYTVIPDELVRGERLNRLWARRQSTKFNGVSFVTQRGAAAVFSERGEREIAENIGYYRENARLIEGALTRLGIWHTGGIHSPYLWMRCPGGRGSWQFFDELLDCIQVVGTPGCGFGANGEGFFRLTAFSSREDTAEAVARLSEYLK